MILLINKKLCGIMKTVISVCGSDADDVALSDYALKTAHRVGKLIAKNKNER